MHTDHQRNGSKLVRARPTAGASVPARPGCGRGRSAATSARRCSPSSPKSPGHGYDIMSRLEEKSGGAWRPSAGSVYPTLQQLEDEGLATSAETDGKRVYTITAAGAEEATRRVAEAGAEPWAVRARRRRAPRSPVPLDRRPRPGRHARSSTPAPRPSSPRSSRSSTTPAASVYRLLADEPTDTAVTERARGDGQLRSPATQAAGRRSCAGASVARVACEVPP